MTMREAMRSLAVGALLLRERWESGVSYNPLSAEMAQDPYPSYAKLRARDPVHRSRLMQAWLFSRDADVDTMLRDHQHFSSDPAQADPIRRAAGQPCRTSTSRACCSSTRRITRGYGHWSTRRSRRGRSPPSSRTSAS